MSTMLESIGLPPGTPVFVGEQQSEAVKITLYDYDDAHTERRIVQSIEECFPYKDMPSVTWINVDGLHDVAMLERLAHDYGLHPLTIEDIVNTQQRPKVEFFDNYIALNLKMYTFDINTYELDIDHVSLVLGKNFVLTFQERQGDLFDAIRARIQYNKGKIKKGGADYLAYSLLDAIVDGYFKVLDRIGDEIEDIEEKLFTNPESSILQDLHDLRQELIFFRKTVWPLRTIMNELDRQETELIEDSTSVYLRDLYDHVVQVIETLETFREMLSGHLEVYLSTISNKTNEIMKFLTIIGTIFIPLTFIAGVYGMNFKYMPELEWRWGYYLIWAIMIGIGVALLAYFRKKKWI